MAFKLTDEERRLSNATNMLTDSQFSAGRTGQQKSSSPINFKLTDAERSLSNATNRLDNQQFSQLASAPRALNITQDDVQGALQGFARGVERVPDVVSNFFTSPRGTGGALDLFDSAKKRTDEIGSAIGSKLADITATPTPEVPASTLRSGRETGQNIRLATPQQAQRVLNRVSPGTGVIYQSGPAGLGQLRRTTNADSPPLRGNVNPETGVPYYIEGLQGANDIRREIIRTSGEPTFDPSQVVVAGGGQDDARGSLRKERLRLAKALEDGTGNFQQNFRALQALDDIARTDAALAGAAPNAADLGALGLRQDQFGLQQDQFALDQAKFLNAPADFKEETFKSTLDTYREAQSSGLLDDNPNLRLELLTSLRNLANGIGYLEQIYEGIAPQNFEAGGYVGAIETYANGGMISPSGPPPMPAIMQQYQQYADGARQMGLTAVPFEQFAALQSSSKDTIPSFADGGMVGENDVSGKMIVDTDPDAPTDSIPAMIDGQRPAALDSGEFVIPKDVVLYYGTDKLQKMIDKVRNPQGGQGNGGTQTALGI